MDKEIRGKWIKALRSGEYKQSYGDLRYFNKFCALGVLCDVLDSSAWDALGNGYYKHDKAESNLPKRKIIEDLQMDWGDVISIHRLNDIMKLSFRELAGWIEFWL